MNARILVVDDNREDIALLKESLSVWGHEIVITSSGEEALKIVKEQKIDAVLLDVVLPGIDGFEVCKRLKTDEETKFIPVLMITSLRKEYRLLAINLGADEFLPKPIDKVELNVRVNSLLRIKSLHDQLAANYKQLEELVKFKDYLSSTITHDINNHLTVIKSFLEIVSARKDALPDPVREGLVITVKACEGLISLVSDFIDVKRMEESKLSLHPEEADIIVLIRSAIEELNLIAKDAGVKLVKKETEENIAANMDKRLISRVLINLAINAIKATPRGGTVEIGVLRQDDGIKVFVSDTGIGILPENKEKIFEKFVTGESKDADSKIGKGLGLTFCKFAVEQHGGKIWVDSEGKDKGATFTFTIPKKP